MDIIKQLESFYSGMTVSEKNITDQILNNLKPLAYDSAKEAATVYQTSPATLVRLAKHIGLSGYSELSFQTKVFLEKDQKKFIKKDNPNDLSYFTNAFNNAISKLNNAELQSNLEKLAKSLQKANRIFAIGIGHSGLAAEYLKYLFMRQKLAINTINDQPQITYLDKIIRSEDLVIVITASGSEKIYQKIYKRCLKKDVVLAIITMNPNTPIFEKADIQCSLPTVSSVNSNYQVLSMDSRSIFFIVISLLQQIYLDQ